MNVCAAIKIAEAAPEGSVVVTILCDNGVKCVFPAPQCRRCGSTVLVRCSHSVTILAFTSRWVPCMRSLGVSSGVQISADIYQRFTATNGLGRTAFRLWKTLVFSASSEIPMLTRIAIDNDSVHLEYSVCMCACVRVCMGAHPMALSAAIWIDAARQCARLVSTLYPLPCAQSFAFFRTKVSHLLIDSMLLLHRARYVVPPSLNEIPERDVLRRLC